MTPHSPQTHNHLLLPTLLLVVSFSTTSSVGISGSEAGGDSPLNTYFNKDNERLTIFDYAALGKTPDEKPSLLKIETSESEAADPSGKSTLQAILEKVMSRQEATQEYFTGRKVNIVPSVAVKYSFDFVSPFFNGRSRGIVILILFFPLPLP